jgi:hypothetical protein
MKQKRYIITEKTINKLASSYYCPGHAGLGSGRDCPQTKCTICWLRALGAKEVKDE